MEKTTAWRRISYSQWRFSNPGSVTWRIIPFSKWLVIMVSKSPNWGYSPSKMASMAYEWRLLWLELILQVGKIIKHPKRNIFRIRKRKSFRESYEKPILMILQVSHL